MLRADWLQSAANRELNAKVERLNGEIVKLTESVESLTDVMNAEQQLRRDFGITEEERARRMAEFDRLRREHEHEGR